jgi:hypothetical protein
MKPRPALKRTTATKDIILVDRSLPIVYPDWVTGAMHPNLEKSGPTDFAPGALNLWHPAQNKTPRPVKGGHLYKLLKEAAMLKRCLGLRDLEEIQKRGIAFYRKHFGSKAVFGWKSVVRDRLKYLFVPYLFEFGDGVMVHWYLLDFAWERATVLVHS